MRKITAITLISVFILAQYGRQLIYMECKLSNTFRVSSQKCDCIKIAGLQEKSNEQPVSKTHHHVHIDEFYPEVKILSGNHTPDLNTNLFNPFFAVRLCDGVLNYPERPPCVKS